MSKSQFLHCVPIAYSEEDKNPNRRRSINEQIAPNDGKGHSN